MKTKMKDKQKCSVPRCKEESDITLPDDTGLCWKHWAERCGKEQKDGLNQTKKGLEEHSQTGQDPAYNCL